MVAGAMQANVHDAFFKAMFSRVEHAASVLRGILPSKLAARIDFNTLALCSGSFVDAALKERYGDLLFSAMIGGRPGLIYLLFEHQSSSDGKMTFLLLRYMVRIWESWQKENPHAKKLPIIVPVVLHHSTDGWTGSTAFEDLLDTDEDTLAAVAEHVPRFRFVLEDISHQTDDALKARAMTALARLALWCLRHAREPHELVARLGQWVDLLREVRRAPDGAAAIVLILRYILATSEPSKPEELVGQLLAAVGDEGKEEIVTAAEQLIERGREQGQLQAHRDLLLMLLGKRFGAVPETAIAQINAADTAQLEVWVTRTLSEPTLAEVLVVP